MKERIFKTYDDFVENGLYDLTCFKNVKNFQYFKFDKLNANKKMVFGYYFLVQKPNGKLYIKQLKSPLDNDHSIIAKATVIHPRTAKLVDLDD